MTTAMISAGYHDRTARATYAAMAPRYHTENRTSYTFQNHFHPFVGELLEQLNRGSVEGLLSLHTQRLHRDFFQALYRPNPGQARALEVKYGPAEVDLAEDGAYSVYNWELFFHIPVTVAVHLSRNGRFAEAQRWFHYVFDPTCNDAGVPPGRRFWKFRPFRDGGAGLQIDELLRVLAKPEHTCTPAEKALRQSVLRGLEAVRSRPFQPHPVARTRPVAFMLWVVMKYLDNLVAWGDSLFRQDTMESVSEATQLYVLAAGILGPRPQRVPPAGSAGARSYRQLRAQRMDAMGNALVEMEAQFPFNLSLPSPQPASTAQAAPLLGIGRALYFGIPRNDRLLGYWDSVGDRLFKIRNCMNLSGVVRQLPLFDPPLDPGMLVKAAAAGIDIGGLVSGLAQPLSPVRATFLLQKALELCGEVRSMGAALLSAIEKHEGEKLALLRQQHEMRLQELARDVRYLQWQEARSATEGLLRTRASAVERYRHYQRLLGKPAEESAALEALSLERRKLTEEEFDDVYRELVGKYAQEPARAAPPALRVMDAVSPLARTGGGDGKLALTVNEYVPLNVLAPVSLGLRTAASAVDVTASLLALIPDLNAVLAYWGIGVDGRMTGGDKLAAAGRAVSGSLHGLAAIADATASGMTQTAGYERRLDDWTLQHNLAARELAQIGRQIVSSLIREEITRHEYENHAAQMEQTRQVDEFMRGKFAGEELYGWMQGELSKLCHEYYRLAFDVARRAERAVKHELMRPELDGTGFVRFDHWDGGRRGLLAGEGLHLDLKRLETAYHEHNRREYELTRHVSLRQLDPLALLLLRATGECEVTVPEWLFDLDCPGHYLRRLRSVSLSIPAVAGPYTSVSCTLSLLRSTLRRSPSGGENGYGREGSEDPRFVDYFGTVQSVVTSGGADDAGLFEPGARDERYLPFEGAGAESTWRLELPAEHRQWDYATISDVVLHLRYTAREGGAPLRKGAVKRVGELLRTDQATPLAQLLDLKHDFPSEWQLFVTREDGGGMNLTLRREHFPYLAQAQAKTITVQSIQVLAMVDGDVVSHPPEATAALGPATLDRDVLTGADGDRVFLLIRYTIDENPV